jgi:hypothetical protein
MATLLKYLLLIGTSAGAFLLSYEDMVSGKEQQLVDLNQTILHMQEWSSYHSTQTILADGKRVVQLESKVRTNPDVILVDSKAKLTDTEDFHFETYFLPDVILVHMFEQDTWKKVDYTHPVAGELQGSKEPFEFWRRMLTYSKTIEKKEKGTSNEHYEIALNPFQDEIHGIRFEDLNSATLSIWMQSEPPGIRKMLLHAQFKPIISRIYDKLDYQIEFSHMNEPVDIQIPAEGKNAPKLQ